MLILYGVLLKAQKHVACMLLIAPGLASYFFLLGGYICTPKIYQHTHHYGEHKYESVILEHRRVMPQHSSSSLCIVGCELHTQKKTTQTCVYCNIICFTINGNPLLR